MSVNAPNFHSKTFDNLEIPSVIASRTRALATGLVLLQASPAHAQWWQRAPSDFEECADLAEKAPNKQDRTWALGECNAKFAGRRKPGGGYTYYDFLQDRAFDIAGPNPTAEEQKKIDEAYASYLADQRRANLEAEAAARQLPQQQQPLQQPQEIQRAAPQAKPEQAKPGQDTSERAKPERAKSENGSTPHVRQKHTPSIDNLQTRAKGSPCVEASFSCEWPRLSEGLNGLRKLFKLPSGNTDKKG